MALAGVVAVLVLVAGSAARAQTVFPPKASILVDADTGAVLDGLNIHEPLPPASLTKIVTALAAVAALPAHTPVPVSARAAGMPAHNLNMKEGQIWSIEDVLGALLVSSANDAGMALAERVSGSAENFSAALNKTAARLGMADQPLLQDPSGLDDEFSIRGGNRISARDLAIAARAVLAEPRLSAVVSTRVYSFTGPDGVAHRLGNHNRLLRVYDGAVGMKTGYTKRSLHSLIAAATRNGRTMIAVILDSPGDTYGPAASLLDRGFATPVTAQPAGARLPDVVAVGRVAGADHSRSSTAAPTQQAAAVDGQLADATASSKGWWHSFSVFALKVILGFAAAIAILRIRVRTNHVRRMATRDKSVRIAPARRPKPKPAHAMSRSQSPQPARPVAAHHSRPRPTRPAKLTRPKKPVRLRFPGRYEEPLPEIDPRLARRFEILARTGQVVP